MCYKLSLFHHLMDLWIHSASVEKALWGETINKVKISHFEWKQFSLIATFDWPNMMSVGTLCLGLLVWIQIRCVAILRSMSTFCSLLDDWFNGTNFGMQKCLPFELHVISHNKRVRVFQWPSAYICAQVVLGFWMLNIHRLWIVNIHMLSINMRLICMYCLG